jgi:hypothetical protein
MECDQKNGTLFDRQKRAIYKWSMVKYVYGEVTTLQHLLNDHYKQYQLTTKNT